MGSCQAVSPTPDQHRWQCEWSGREQSGVEWSMGGRGQSGCDQTRKRGQSWTSGEGQTAWGSRLRGDSGAREDSWGRGVIQVVLGALFLSPLAYTVAKKLASWLGSS